jgi:hypothetical protein
VQLIDLRAAEERVVDLEVRVLRRRPDQRDKALLDRGQQGVLLGLVEAVDLVEEEDRAAAAGPALAGAGDDLADLGAAVQADSSSNAASACWAASRASVVLPAPGGPYRTMLCGWPASSDWRSAEPGPSRCSWPTNSSSVCGRIRAASGPSGGAR